MVLLPTSRSCFLSLAAAALMAVLPGSALGIGLMVNEYRAGTGGAVTNKMANDDFIEFVLTTNATAAELAALTFGATTHNTNGIDSVFEFDLTTLNTVLAGAGETEFLAGTILVVKGAGLGAQNLSYNPLNNNLGNSDAWSIELVAGFGAKDHPTASMNNDLNIDRRGSIIWVSTDDPPSNNIDTSGFIHAIGHDNNTGNVADAVIAQFGADHILPTNFPTARTISNTGSGGTVSLSAGVTSTIAAANNAADATWIENSLRMSAIPEPDRALLSFFAVALLVFRRRRPRPATA